MEPISYRYCHFPPTIIQHSVWLYARFSLSFRDVEDLLAERGIDVSYETVRRWVAKFGPQIARRANSQRERAKCVRVLDTHMRITRIRMRENLEPKAEFSIG